MFSLGILLSWTTEELIMSQFASNLGKNHTGRKRPTMAIRVGFLTHWLLGVPHWRVKLSGIRQSKILSLAGLVVKINWEFFRKIIFSGFSLGFPYKSLYFCWLSLTLSLGHLCLDLMACHYSHSRLTDYTFGGLDLGKSDVIYSLAQNFSV